MMEMLPTKLSHYYLGENIIIQGTTDNYIIFCTVRGLDINNLESIVKFNEFYQAFHDPEKLKDEFRKYMEVK
jgi:hypothetical protein